MLIDVCYPLDIIIVVNGMLKHMSWIVQNIGRNGLDINIHAVTYRRSPNEMYYFGLHVMVIGNCNQLLMITSLL